VPQVSATSTSGADATWVGIGGVTFNDLIQAGTEATVTGGRVRYDSWVEMLPQAAQRVAPTVSPGDSITITIARPRRRRRSRPRSQRLRSPFRLVHPAQEVSVTYPSLAPRLYKAWGGIMCRPTRDLRGRSRCHERLIHPVTLGLHSEDAQRDTPVFTVGAFP